MSNSDNNNQSLSLPLIGHSPSSPSSPRLSSSSPRSSPSSLPLITTPIQISSSPTIPITITSPSSSQTTLFEDAKKDTETKQQTIEKINQADPLQLKENYELLTSESVADQLKGVQHFRRILSKEKNPPIREVVSLNIIPILLNLLQQQNNRALLFESAWALTNIASGVSEYCEKVVDGGAIPVLIDVLNNKSNDEDVVDQVAWCIGNIAGDSTQYRDICLRLGVLEPLINVAEIFLKSNSTQKVRNVTWSLSNLVRGKPSPDFEVVKIAIPALALLVESNDSDTRTDACWALSYLSDGSNDRIGVVLASGVAPTIVKLAMDDTTSTSFMTPALRTIGNIVTGDDQQTQVMLDLNVVPLLFKLMSHPKKNLRKEATWTLSNITGGNESQIESVVQYPGMIEKVTEFLETADYDIQKEAVWVVANAANSGSQLLNLLSPVIEPLCKFLDVSDNKIVAATLEGLENLLKVDSSPESLTAARIKNCNGLNSIMKLQNHSHNSISKRAIRVFTTYFQSESLLKSSAELSSSSHSVAITLVSSQPSQKIFDNPVSWDTASVSNIEFPLHVAVSKAASLDIIKLLLDTYPKACQEKNRDAYLPLHVAVSSSASFDTVKLLLDAYPQGSREKSIYGDLPLHVAVSNSASFDTVKLLLDAYPQGSREKNKDRLLPLHEAVSAPLEVIKLLVDAYPQGCQEKSDIKDLPLHYAVNKSAPFEVIKLLVDAYPQGCQEKGSNGSSGTGWLPLHTAIWLKASSEVLKVLQNSLPFPLHDAVRNRFPAEVIKLLVDAFPKSCQEKDRDEYLPLHYAVRTNAPVEMVKLLLDVYPQGSKEVDTYGYFPLHVAVSKNASLEVVKALVDAYPEGSQQKGKDGYMPLHYAVSNKAAVDVVKVLVDVYPQACEEKDKYGALPLHIAISNKASTGVIKILVDTYPQSCKQKYRDGCLPLHVAVNFRTSKESVLSLLSNDLPLSENHSYSWTWTLEKFKADTSVCEYLIREIFDRYYSDQPETCRQLAYSKDEMGRTAISIVHEDTRKLMNMYLLFMGRFDMKQGPPEHTSATCIVIIANDFNSQKKRVALKFMKHSSGYQREIMSRAGIDDIYVLPIDDHFSADGSSENDILFRSSLERAPFLKDYKYLLVLPASDRSLSAIILHEHICGCDWSKIKQILRDICLCLAAVHSQGKIHGDIKPLNVMRLSNGQMCLIDMDASTFFDDACGCKISSGYIPPEMVLINEYDYSYEISTSLLATVSYDMWSLGCVLYYLCTGETLFQGNTSDSLADDTSFYTLSTWSTETKVAKLSKISDSSASNLVSQLLHKDPTKRPDTFHVRSHPFLTGRVSGRLPGDPPSYDVFLSYRVASDLRLVEMLYDKLVALEVKVFWDKLCLANGKNWEEGFAAGLCCSGIFVPVISRAATKKRFESLTADSDTVDSVLLEHRLSLELAARDLITHIYPIYVGDLDSSGNYAKYFETDASPIAPDIQVKKLEASAIHHLDKLGLGSPLLPDITIKGTVERLSKSQAGFVVGDIYSLDTIISSLAKSISNIVTDKRSSTVSLISNFDSLQLQERIKLLESQLADRDKVIAEKDSELRHVIADRDQAIADRDKMISALQTRIASST